MRKIFGKIDYWLLFFFLIVGLYLRMDGVLTGDFPFLFDNGRDLLAVKQIFVDHKLTLIGPFSGLQGVFQNPLWFYLLGIPFILGKGSPVALMIFMVFLGLLGIIMAYLVGRAIFDKNTGLILALLFTISPSVVCLSRIVWPPYPIVYLMLPFYFCIFKAIKGSKKYWLGVGLFGGFIAQFEVAFGLFLLPAIILMFLLFREKKTSLKYILGALFFFLLNFLPQILFDIRHGLLMMHSVLGFFSGQSRGLGNVVPFPDRFFHRLNELQQSTLNSVSRTPLFIYLFFLLVVVYTVFKILRKDKKELKAIEIISLVPLVVFFSFLLYPYVAWSHYWLGLQAVYLLMLAFVLRKILDFKWGKILVIILLGLWSIDTLMSPGLYVKKDDGGPTTYKNEIKALDYVYQDARGKNFSVFVYTPPVYDYAYQYLFWWRGVGEYGFLPGKSKDGLFYLIMEPDQERPWAPNGWKETVIKTGTTLETKVLPGGIMLEKRRGEKYVEN